MNICRSHSICNGIAAGERDGDGSETSYESENEGWMRNPKFHMKVAKRRILIRYSTYSTLPRDCFGHPVTITIDLMGDITLHWLHVNVISGAFHVLIMEASLYVRALVTVENISPFTYEFRLVLSSETKKRNHLMIIKPRKGVLVFWSNG